MMKRIACTLVIGLLTFVAIPGCGGSGESKNVADGVEKSEIEQYQAKIAAEEAAMSDMKLDE